MLWKEWHIRMGGGLKWLGSRPVALLFSVLLGCYVFDAAYPVVADVRRGYWRDQSWSEANASVRITSALLALLAMLPVGAAAATSLTSEREQDTWVSLATTLLTPAEVIRAKQLGAVGSARWIGIGLIVIWSAGLLLGAVHPFGVLAALAIVLFVAWLTAAVGLLASALARNSTRALAATFIALFLVAILSGWPVTLWGSLVSYRQAASWWANPSLFIPGPLWMISPALGQTIQLSAVFGLAAALFSIFAIWRLRATWGRA
jgi:hypothetical protein